MVVPAGDLGERISLQVPLLPLWSLARGNRFDTIAGCVYRHAGWLARVSRQRSQTSGHFPTRVMLTQRASAGAGG
jgi:hypothetical protein